MTLLLKQLFNFIRILNSETGTQQIAWGLSFGLVLGFSPFLSLQTFLVLLICIFFRVQMGAAFLSGFFFSFLAASMDPWADSLGRWILEKPEWRGVFVQLYNMPLVPLTRFNNSIVMGSGALGFLASVPAFFVFTFLIKKYRKEVLMRFQESRFWKFVKATSFYKWYAKYEELYG
jgi:uncharacterized protein (TIGR03546 family)